jgi:hypothetical protein
MPAFDLPEATVNGLVRLIRMLDASRTEAPPEASADAAPAAADAGATGKARAPKDKGQASQ